MVISDRGDLYLPRCLESLPDFPWCQQVIIEDPRHAFTQNGVIEHAWSLVDEDAEFVAHVEEDFVLHEFPVEEMARLLRTNPDLAHVILKRQPWGGDEAAAGGYIECFPDSYEDCDGFLKHQRFFSLNPSLIPIDVVRLGWAGSEGDMTTRCVERGLSFAVYGERHDRPRVTHIGEVSGCG